MKLDESGGKLRFRREEGGGGGEAPSTKRMGAVGRPQLPFVKRPPAENPQASSQRRDLSIPFCNFFFRVEFLERYRQNNFFGSTLFANFPTMGVGFFLAEVGFDGTEENGVSSVAEKGGATQS